MTTEQLTKTQAATLAEIKRIEASDEPAVEFGTQRKGINTQALRTLKAKGLIRCHTVTGIGGNPDAYAEYAVTV